MTHQIKARPQFRYHRNSIGSASDGPALSALFTPSGACVAESTQVHDPSRETRAAQSLNGEWRDDAGAAAHVARERQRWVDASRWLRYSASIASAWRAAGR
jgi:hypothetical protein